MCARLFRFRPSFGHGSAGRRKPEHEGTFPRILERGLAVLRHYYAGFVLMLCEWLESPSPKSTGAFLADLVAALPAPLRPLLL